MKSCVYLLSLFAIAPLAIACDRPFHLEMKEKYSAIISPAGTIEPFTLKQCVELETLLNKEHVATTNSITCVGLMASTAASAYWTWQDFSWKKVLLTCALAYGSLQTLTWHTIARNKVNLQRNKIHQTTNQGLLAQFQTIQGITNKVFQNRSASTEIQIPDNSPYQDPLTPEDKMTLLSFLKDNVVYTDKNIGYLHELDKVFELYQTEGHAYTQPSSSYIEFAQDLQKQKLDSDEEFSIKHHKYLDLLNTHLENKIRGGTTNIEINTSFIKRAQENIKLWEKRNKDLHILAPSLIGASTWGAYLYSAGFFKLS